MNGCISVWRVFCLSLHTYLFSLSLVQSHMHTPMHIVFAFPSTTLYLTCMLSHALLQPPLWDKALVGHKLTTAAAAAAAAA